jgi:hypothetical protein
MPSFCEKCGAPIIAGSKFCEECGSSVGDQPLLPPTDPPKFKETSPPTTPPASMPSSFYIVAGIVVVVIIILAAVFVSMVMSIPNENPIIGVWRYSNSDGFDDRYRFNTEGTFVESVYSPTYKENYVNSGTWSAQGGNSYTLRKTGDAISFTIIYDPAKNTIYDTRYSNLLLTRYQGDVMTY